MNDDEDCGKHPEKCAKGAPCATSTQRTADGLIKWGAKELNGKTLCCYGCGVKWKKGGC